jgi:hypothetical protein
MGKQQSKSLLILMCLAFLTTGELFLFQTTPSACDVAVISGKVTVTGRPMIWKNRDHADTWHQELIYYEAVKSEVGGSIRIMDRITTAWMDVDGDDDDASYITGPIMSGGVNESGFAITNTTVYEWNPINEFFNGNVPLMEEALEKCKTVSDFDGLIKLFKANPLNWDKVISGNFVVLDASGGAALYEIYSGDYGFLAPLQFKKFDANDPEDAPHGFVNRTNSNSYLDRNSDTRREERGLEILETLYEAEDLSLENILSTLTKDVCGDDILPGESLPTQDAANNDPKNFNTDKCISRYLTNFAMVVDGVGLGESPLLTTLWLNLGEPAVGVFTPHFAGVRKVTPYAWAESDLESLSPVNASTTCALNQMINDQELTLYANNVGDIFTAMDLTIDYESLRDTQSWSVPLEKTVVGNCDILLNQYRKGILPQGKTLEEALYALSHYAASYVYMNYTHQSDSFEAWDFGDLSVDTGSDDNFPSFTRFMMWLVKTLRLL